MTLPQPSPINVRKRQFAKQLEEKSARELESQVSMLQERLDAVEAQIRQRMEKRGELSANIQILADDRQLPNKQLELAMVEKRLEEAIDRWQVLATTCRIMDHIRATYEQERQPETLQEASGYLNRLTQGRYQRVWTPLGENVLRVDDAEGHCLPVEKLSRGTREQLFLSLRMALAASYARRGAALPLVLRRRAGEFRRRSGRRCRRRIARFCRHRSSTPGLHLPRAYFQYICIA